MMDQYMRKLISRQLLVSLLAVASVALALPAVSSEEGEPTKKLIIGLDSDMSSGAAESGEALRRGAFLAVKEINLAGGVLGSELELVVRDHRGNPARGIDNLNEFAEMDSLLAVIGGFHTPVLLAELETIHNHKILTVVAWAAGTAIVENGYTPNYVFRVSVRDEFAGEVLTDHASKKGCSKPGLLLERTGWGRSNEKAIEDALSGRNRDSAGTVWFDWGVTGLNEEVSDLIENGAECLLLVCNPREGVLVAKAMAGLPEQKRVPIISHWGIVGGGREFYRKIEPYVGQIDLSFIQTYSFMDPPFEYRSERLFLMYRDEFQDVKVPEDIFTPAATAHAYEAVHLLALAAKKANSREPNQVRDALENLGEYAGLIRHFDPPFTPTRHDALSKEDIRMCRYGKNGIILPTNVTTK